LKDNRHKLLPLMIDLNNKRVVIFGGGQVGERKAALFFRYGPTTVISRSFTPGIQELKQQGLSLIKKQLLSDDEILHHIKDAFIVIPTTSDLEFNKHISDLAHEMGCLVNSVDGLEDLAVPSIIERGDITLAISTHGASPALSKFMRLKIEEAIPDKSEFKEMARLLKDMRKILKQEVADQKDRSGILWSILEDKDVWNALGESYENGLDIALKHISYKEKKPA
jgi:precorrin-2 dehydrogenase/sirohydrochlorin ferrochelatase